MKAKFKEKIRAPSYIGGSDYLLNAKDREIN